MVLSLPLSHVSGEGQGAVHHGEKKNMEIFVNDHLVTQAHKQIISDHAER